jgi:hypothetical protein
VGTVRQTYFLDSGLAPNSSHDYQVVAFDAAGNNSLPSASSAKTSSIGIATTGTLAGVVFTRAGTPLAGATASVLINGTVKTTKTNATGVWKLSSLPAGSYEVTVGLTGYEPTSLTMAAAAGQTILALSALG